MNLVINGTFDTDVANWTGQNGIVSWDAGAQQLIITTDPGGAIGIAYQSIPLVVNTLYKYSAYHAGFQGRIAIGVAPGDTTYFDSGPIPDDTTISGNVFITGTPAVFSLSANSATLGAARNYDNIVLAPYGAKGVFGGGMGMTMRL